MFIILEVFLKGIGYSLIIYSLWMMVGSDFYHTYIRNGIRKWKEKRVRRLRKLQYEIEEPSIDKDKSWFILHLETLLESISKNGKSNVTNFIMLSVILFSVTFILLLFLIKDPAFSLFVGIILGITPYLLVLYRLAFIRMKTSHAFMNEFHIILQSYQSSNNNIYYTLLNTVDHLEDKHMKQQFRKIISSIQKERTEKDFRRVVYIFVYSINSTFAKRFGNLLLKAYLENAEIGRPLSNLNNDISQRKKDMENEITEKMETVMVGFSPIVVLPLIIYFAQEITGVIDFWHYFTHTTSLTVFIITVLASVASIALAMLIRKPRADI